MKKLNPLSFPIIPILAAMIPVAFLAAENIDQIDRFDITRSVLVTFLLGCLVLVILRVVTRSWTKASLLGGLYLLLFFSYGHAYQWVEARKLFLGHHSILLPIYMVIAGIVTWFILCSKAGAERLHVPLNAILLVLFLFSAVPAGYRLIQYELELRGNQKTSVSVQDGLPDVYFIILDAYARDDVLKEKFGFDNSAFTDRLKALGFTILPCSQSNYQITLPSVLSTFSMDYLSPTPDEMSGSAFPSEIPIERDRIIHNPVRATLENLGYVTVSFESAYPWTETPDVEHYYRADIHQTFSIINKFESTLIRSSMGMLYLEFMPRPATQLNESLIDPNTFDESAEFYYLVHRNTLDKLDTISQLPGPKYVYAHLGAPHEPYVLARDGSFALESKQTGEPYINQLTYVNQRITRIIETILRESEIPPIIVLESDHGIDPNNKDTRLKNLMAFYAPDELSSRLYPTMTPINSFRLVLNYLDGGTRPLLPDYSFFSPDMGNIDFELIPNTCQ